MSRRSELVKNTAILTFGKICTQFIQFLLLPLYTALLVPEEFGIVDVFNTYITLLVPLFNWQFENGLFRFLLECRTDEQRQKTLVSTVVLSNIVQAALYILFYIVAQGFIHTEYKVFLAIDVVANIFLNTFMQMSRGINKNSIYAFSSFLSVTIMILLNVVFIVGFRMGATGMFLATAISKGATIGYLVFIQRVWHYFSFLRFDWIEFKKILRYSLPLVPNAISWWVINASNRSIITLAIGVAANGVFAVANKFSSIIITIYNVFNMAWTETASIHMNEEDSNSFLKETINIVFNLFASGVLVFMAAMPFLFPLMVDAQYTSAYPLIPMLMLAALFQVVQGLYSVVYVALKKTVKIAKTSVCAAAINLIVDVLLIRLIGLYAAAIATLVAYASMAIYRYIDIKKYINARIEKISIIMTIIACSIVIVAYYMDIALLSAVVLLVTIFCCTLVNRQTIRTIFDLVLEKIKIAFLIKNNKKFTSKQLDEAGNGLPMLQYKREDCCGCGACSCICPTQAIEMKRDLEGFVYPEVNDHTCVHCGQCLAVCAFKWDMADAKE